MSFVRSSKFRHVFGTAAKKDKCYDNLKITRSPHESYMSSVNAKFLAVVLEAQGGGKFIVLPLEKVGRVDINHPTVTGHKSQVMDLAWNPFNDNEIASASEDCTIKLWEIPDGGLKEQMTDPSLTLDKHSKKVQHLRWHPSAANVLASSAADNVIIVWNTETGDQLMTTEPFPDMLQSISWSYNGSQIACTCKDKMIRVLNAHTGEIVQQGAGHSGNKPSRVIFCGRMNKLFTSGFSRMSEREYALWDPKKLDKALTMEKIDSGSGVQFPIWDEGTHMVYLVGKGDTQIRYFEVTDEAPYVFFLSMYQSTTGQRSVCFLPKRELDVMKCEVMRFFKLQNNMVEPIAMTVPRKADSFQEDIFPPCPSAEPAITAEEWYGGTDADPKLMNLKPGGGAAAPVAKKKVTALKKQTPKGLSADGPEPAPMPGEPKTLEEYRKAYKLLEEENRKLREKLGM